MYSETARSDTSTRHFLLVVFCLVCTCCQPPSVLVTMEQRKGDEAFNAYHYEEALTHYQSMLDASARLGIYRNPLSEAGVHRKMADARVMLGQYDMVFDHLDRANALDSAENNALGVIDNTLKKGRVCFYMGDYRKGIEYLERTLQLSEGLDESLKNTNRLRAAEAQLTLARYYTVLGRFGEGKVHAMKALGLFRAIPDEAGHAEALLLLGQIHLDLGMPLQAEDYLRQSADIAGKAGLKPVQQYQTLGELMASRGEFEAAIRMKTHAADLANTTQILAQQIWAMTGLGDVYMEIGNREKGFDCYQQVISLKNRAELQAASLQASLDMRLGNLEEARDFFAEVGSGTGLGLVYLRMGTAWAEEGKRDSSIHYMRLARHAFQQSGNAFGLAVAELNMGRHHAVLANRDSAMGYLNLSHSRGDFPEITWQIWYYKGLAEERTGRLSEAAAAYRKAIEVIEEIRGNFTIEEFKATYLENRQEVYDRLIQLLLDENDPEEAFFFAERARSRAFLDMLGNRSILFREGAADEWTLKEQDLRLRIQKLHKMLARSSTQDEQDAVSRQSRETGIYRELETARREYSEVLTRLKLSNPQHLAAVTVEPYSMNEIRSSMDPGSCMVVYWTFPEKTCIWVVSDKQHWFETVPAGSDTLDVLVQQARQFIASNAMSRMEKPLRELYNILIAPVEEVLEKYNYRTIVPKGSLHFLPFQALMDKNGDFLVDHCVISYAPSASVWKLCKDSFSDTGEGFLGMALGDIEVGGSHGLPGTTKELTEIAPLFSQPLIFYAENATETSFKQHAGGKRYIHLATHGFTDFHDPLYSFLLFPPDEDDDGRLLLTEVMGIRLNARLVSLSACQTGLGNISRGDELVSLNRSFIYAGTPAVISSLWDVSDYTTALLMKEFYIQARDHSFARALTIAQRKVKDQFLSPNYWAPFVLNGNGYLKLQ